RPECIRHWHGQLFAAAPKFRLLLAIGTYAQRYRCRQEKRHGNSAQLAGIWSICDTAAASVVAQQWMVEKESVVRSRAYPASARASGESAVHRALTLTTSPPARGRVGWGSWIARITAVCVLALTAACAPKLAAEGPEMR